MYDLNNMCCICLCNKKNLQFLSLSDADRITYYFKLTAAIPEMRFEELNDQRLICRVCCETIDIIYKFRQKCLKSKNMLVDYITQIQAKNKINDHFNVYMNDSGQIKVDDRNIKNEIVNTDAEENLAKNQDFTFVNVGDIKTEKVDYYHNNTDFEAENAINTFAEPEISLNEYPDDNMQQNLSDFSQENLDIFGASTSYETWKKKQDEKIVTNEFSPSTHICQICNKDFGYLSILKVHMRIHSGEKPFECELCKKTFTQKKHYNDHILSHNGESPFVCKVCKKRLSTKNDLQIHSRIHTGEKPFMCNICYKKFTVAGNLSTHMRTHTGEKPFQCNICSKKFNQSPHLTAHMRTHTGERPFKCDVCDFRFTSKSNLYKHYIVHTGEKPFKCDMCNKKFTQSSSLAKHMRKHIGEELYLEQMPVINIKCEPLSLEDNDS